jgi:hypothetical protein
MDDPAEAVPAEPLVGQLVGDDRRHCHYR